MKPNLIRLLTVMSPNFPIGGFGYSYGLEAAFQADIIKNADDLKQWVKGLMTFGSLRNDAVLLAESWRASNHTNDLKYIQENAEALTTSKTRLSEQYALGKSFIEAVSDAYDTKLNTLPNPIFLPVAVGALAATFNIPLTDTIIGFTHNGVNGLIQAALRLAPIGQRRGVQALGEIETDIVKMSEEIVDTTLDDIDTSALIADTLAMQHETLKSRIFLS